MALSVVVKDVLEDALIETVFGVGAARSVR